jgi:hypothetical protein
VFENIFASRPLLSETLSPGKIVKPWKVCKGYFVFDVNLWVAQSLRKSRLKGTLLCSGFELRYKAFSTKRFENVLVHT